MTAKKKGREHIVSLVASLPDGTHIVEHPDGKLERRKSETDWATFDALTDEQIEEAIHKHPDVMPLDFNWSDAVLVIPPKKRRSRSESTRTCWIISSTRAPAISGA